MCDIPAASHYHAMVAPAPMPRGAPPQKTASYIVRLFHEHPCSRDHYNTVKCRPHRRAYTQVRSAGTHAPTPTATLPGARFVRPSGVPSHVYCVCVCACVRRAALAPWLRPHPCTRIGVPPGNSFTHPTFPTGSRASAPAASPPGALPKRRGEPSPCPTGSALAPTVVLSRPPQHLQAPAPSGERRGSRTRPLDLGAPARLRPRPAARRTCKTP